MKNFNIMGVHSGGTGGAGVADLRKKRVADLRRGLGKKEWEVFSRGED